MKFYNLSIDIRQRKCVVIGGGKVALRKTRKLCKAQAKVVVVSPDLLPEFEQDHSLAKIEIIRKKYSPDVLAEAILVFAATSDFNVNQQICKDAEKLGIWSNSVNGAEYGSFIIPATCSKSLITIGITTEGKAPALSKSLREFLEQKLSTIDDDLILDIIKLRKKKISVNNNQEKNLIEYQIIEKTKKIIQQISQ